MHRVDPATLRRWIGDGAEIALLDAREEGEFGTSHLFWAVPCPLSQRERRAPALVPRRSVRIACVDDGRGLAETLALWLEAAGWTDVAVLDGGVPAWGAAGLPLFSGINVPSKAFGEWVEHHYGTESVDAPELRRWLDGGRKVLVLDSRPFDEFERMSIPTALNIPGGELVYRIGDAVHDAETTVVVNCAGRTRSILGAESLRRAGVLNRVVALRNGTMGWELAGFACSRGSTARYTAGRPARAAAAWAGARAFAAASGVREIDAAGLADLAADPARTLYVLDVRSPEEFQLEHCPGSRNAPGGQLVQAADNWIGVRGARIALIDDDGVRARMTGAWLRQMGYRDVFAADGALAGTGAVTNRANASLPSAPNAPIVDVAAVAALIEEAAPVAIIDLARSTVFREGHIPGAVWGVRTRLELLRPRLAGAEQVIITSPDGALALLALAEAASLTTAPVAALEGGTAAWLAAGGAFAATPGDPPDAACIDAYLRPYDRQTGAAAAMRDYLAWEVDLLRAVAADDTVHFGVLAE
jgi:rhodanese-related sulfurtransferase